MLQQRAEPLLESVSLPDVGAGGYEGLPSDFTFDIDPNGAHCLTVVLFVHAVAVTAAAPPCWFVPPLLAAIGSRFNSAKASQTESASQSTQQRQIGLRLTTRLPRLRLAEH